MPALTTRDLRNFKGHFRVAVRTILEAAGWSDVVLERASAKLRAAARKEIAFDLGGVLNEETLPTGTHVYDFFAARLRVRIVTARRTDESFPGADATDLHERFVSEALDLLAEEKNPFSEALLPYYAVKMIRPAGTRSDFDPIYFEDFTDVDFELQFGIRSSAWPVGT